MGKNSKHGDNQNSSKKLKAKPHSSDVKKHHKTDDGSGKTQESKSTPGVGPVGLVSSSKSSRKRSTDDAAPSRSDHRRSLSISGLNPRNRSRSGTADDIATARPTPLSPSFSATNPASAPSRRVSRVPGTSITVPVDRKESGGWLANRLREVRNQAKVKPTFTAEPIHVVDDHETSVEQSPKTPKKKDKGKKSKKENKHKSKSKTKDETKAKKERKSRDPKSSEVEEVESPDNNQSEQEIEIDNANANASDRDDDHEASDRNSPSPVRRSSAREKSEPSAAVESDAGHAIRSVESPRAAKKRERKNEKRREAQRRKQEAKDNVITVNGMQVQVPAGLVVDNGLKRKLSNDMDPHASFSARLEGETRAIKRLREALPGHKVLRTTQRLFRELGSVPSDMAVLTEVARETIVDLATSQVSQAIGGGIAGDNNSQHRSNQNESLGSEIMRMVQEQKVKLEKLERDMEKARSEEMNRKNKTRADEDVTSNSERDNMDDAVRTHEVAVRGESREGQEATPSPTGRRDSNSSSGHDAGSESESDSDSDSDSSTSDSDSDSDSDI